MNDIWRLLRACAGATSPPPGPTPPGSSWTPRNPSPAASFGGQSVAWSPELNLFVVVGYSTKLATSPNGINWTVRNVPFEGQTSFTSVIWVKELGLFVAVALQPESSSSSTTKTIMTSPDGINWTLRVGTFKGAWTDIAWSPSLGLLVVVRVATSGVSDTQPRFMTSPDGINWTNRTHVGSAVNNGFDTVCWSPDLNLFVAGGRNSTFATSSDGINWQTTPFPSGVSQKIYWSHTYGLFYATSNSRFWYSTNGFTWVQATSVTSGSFIQGTTDTGQNLLAVVGSGSTAGVTWKSEDGMNWASTITGIMPNTAFWPDIAYSPSLNRAVAVSMTSPYIATSPT